MTHEQDEPKKEQRQSQSIADNSEINNFNANNISQKQSFHYYIRININRLFGSLSKRRKRSILNFLLGVSIALIGVGFINLLIYRLIDNKARLLLIVGCSLFAIICSYYAFFWNPPNSARSKVIWKLFAAVGMVVIPLLTVVGVCLWMNAPPKPIVTLANYDVKQNDFYSNKQEDLNTVVADRLRNYTKDIEVQQIDKNFHSANGKEAASEGRDRRATISIWGNYNTDKNDKMKPIKVNSFLAILKKPLVVLLSKAAKDKKFTNEYNEQGYWEEVVSKDGLKPSEIDINDKDEQELRNSLASLTNLFAGIAFYKSGVDYCDPKKQEVKESFDKSRQYLELARKQLENIKENKTRLSKESLNKQTLEYFLTSIAEFYNGNTHLYKAYCSDQRKDLDSAIDSFKLAIESIFYVAILEGRQSSYVVEYPYKLTLASYIPRGEYPWSFDDGNDNQEIICGNKRQDKNVWVSNSPKGFKILLSRVYYNRGIAYAMKGDSESALADFKNAIQHDSETNEFCIGLASAYAELGYYDSAIEIYERVIGKTNFAIKIYNSAIKIYERAIGETPNIETSLAYNNLINTYLRRGEEGDEEKASKKYKEAIELDSNIFEDYENEKRAKFFEDYENEKRSEFFEERKNDLQSLGEALQKVNILPPKPSPRGRWRIPIWLMGTWRTR